MLDQIEKNNDLRFEKSTLQSLFNEEEFQLFRSTVCSTASHFSNIQGVLITGSLVQRLYLPEVIDNQIKTSKQEAYQEIVCRSQRRLFPHINSDLDIWLLVDDGKDTKSVPAQLDELSAELVKWYSDNIPINLKEWIDKKHIAFDRYYKQDYLYPKNWLNRNSFPYLANGFTDLLISNIDHSLQSFRKRVNHFFIKEYPHEFLEVRAYPSCVFNLRPEKINLPDGTIDRTPFAYFMKDWLDLEQNTIVLYTRKDDESYIYPFRRNGSIRGQEFAESIGWNFDHNSYCLFKRPEGKEYEGTH